MDELLGRQVCGQRRWEVLIDVGKQQSMRRGVSIEQDQISVFVVKFGRLCVRATVPANKRCWAEEGTPHT